MDITKNARRWMAAVMAMALALTGLVAAPKTADAATTAPTVKVKGATLKLEGTADGKQSMRIGVEINNADLATACGMKIEYKGSSVTVATDNGYDKIYDYDENHQKVVYTAVITGIPSTAFADDFTITGLVKGTDDTDYIESSSSVTKSINGIVDSLGADYKLAEGILLKKSSELDINNVKDGIYAWEQAVIDNGCTSEVATYNGQTCLKVSDGTRTKDDGSEISVSASVKFKFSETNSAGRKFFVDVNACSASGYKITSYSPETKKTEATDFLQTGVFITGNSVHGYEQFTVAPNTSGDDLYVKSFVIYEAVSSLGYDDMEIDKGFVNLSTANETINDPINTISYADGKANITKLSKEFGGFGVAYNIKPRNQKINLADYTQVKLNITAKAAYPLCIKLYNNVTGDGYWKRIESTSGGVEYFDIKAGTQTYTFTIANNLKGSLTEAEAIFIKINPPKENAVDAAFTINSIQFE